MSYSQKWGLSVCDRVLPQFSQILYTNGHHRALESQRASRLERSPRLTHAG